MRCRKWFQEDRLIELDYNDILDVFDAYCFDVTALDRINKHAAIAKMKELGKDLPESKTNWSDFLIDEAECLESGAEITRSRPESKSGVLVIDSMHRKIEKEMHFTWIAIDSLKGEAVHYDVTADRKLPAVLQFLFELKLSGGYEAIIIVCDLEPAIIAAVRLVFPNAKIQGCVIHRMRTLYKKLRTLKRNGQPIKNISPERLRVRTEFIELARKLIHSATPEEKQLRAEQMKSSEKYWELDPQTHQQYRVLISKLKFYLTRQELGECPDNTNQCESANDLFSKFVTRRQGFKNLRAARAYLKAFFAVFRLKRNGTIGRKDSPYLLTAALTPESESPPPHVPEQIIQENAMESENAPQAMDVNIGATPVTMEERTEDRGEDMLDTLVSPATLQVKEQSPAESEIQDNLVAGPIQDELAIKIDPEALQKLVKMEAEILDLKSADAYCLQSPKAYVNKFESIARKLGADASSIAINKIDGSVIKLTPQQRKLRNHCRVMSVDVDCLSQLELQRLAECFDQMTSSLIGPYCKYGDVKSYENQFTRIANRRSKSATHSKFGKQDGRISDFK